MPMGNRRTARVLAAWLGDGGGLSWLLLLFVVRVGGILLIMDDALLVWRMDYRL